MHFADGTLDQCIALETFSGAACFHVFRLDARREEFRRIFTERAKAAPLQSQRFALTHS